MLQFSADTGLSHLIYLQLNVAVMVWIMEIIGDKPIEEIIIEIYESVK